MGSGDITDISIVTIVRIDIVRICGFYVIVERYPSQLLLSGTISTSVTHLHWPCWEIINVYKHTPYRFGWDHSKFNQHTCGFIMSNKYVQTVVQACSYFNSLVATQTTQTCIDCCWKNCQCNFPLVASGYNGEGRKLYFVRENESEDRIAPTCSWETEGGRYREFPFLN